MNSNGRTDNNFSTEMIKTYYLTLFVIFLAENSVFKSNYQILTYFYLVLIQFFLLKCI